MALRKLKTKTKTKDSEPPEPRRERRALSHVGGKVSCSGPATELHPLLKHALAVSSDESAVREHVHGFHSYPARLHPVTARRLLQKLAAPGSSVLDPFCGSGTVLVEGQLRGCRTVGVDLNPLACELSRFKTTRSSESEREEWWQAAERVAHSAEERRQARAGPTRLYKPHERAPYDPHILFELDGLTAAIASEPAALQRVLRLILSSILTKVSRSLGDTSRRLAPRRLASGFAIRTFVNKAREVCAQHAEYMALLPAGASSKVILGDARRLPGLNPASVDLVLSSPPYPGVFDYLSHHANRLHWLGLDAKELARGEIGSRRQLAPLPAREALQRWRADFSAVLRGLARVMKPGRYAVLVMADSALRDLPIRVDEEVAMLAAETDFESCAQGSQDRPHFHEPTRRAFAGKPRREHLLVLRRGAQRRPAPRER